MRQILFFCLVTFTIVACNSAKENLSLTGVNWVAESLNGKDIKLKEKDRKVTMRLESENTKVVGEAGCNRFFGTYQLEGEKLTFSQMGATRMACPDMDIELTFFKVLDETTSFVIKNDKLSLKNDGDVIAIFKAEKVEKKKK